MKEFLLSLLYCLALLQGKAQSVGIGTTAPNTAAILDVSSTTKPMIVPRLATSAITNIGTPADGMLVFNTDTKTFWGYSSGGISTAVSQTTVNNTLTVNTGSDVGQSFTPQWDMLLQSLSVNVSAFAGTSAIFALKIHAGEGYAGAVVVSSSFAVTAPAALEFDLSTSNIELKANQVYTIELDQLTGSAITTFSIANTNPYPGGHLYAGSAILGSDLYFLIKQKVVAGWKSLSK